MEFSEEEMARLLLQQSTVGQAQDLARAAAAFYASLTQNGVPPEVASDLTMGWLGLTFQLGK